MQFCRGDLTLINFRVSRLIKTSFNRNTCTRLSSTLQSSHKQATVPKNDATENTTPELSSPIPQELRQKLKIHFKRADLGKFTQVPPHQENLFTNNAFLTSYVDRVFPDQIKEEIWNDLTRLGKSAVVDIYPIGRQCELEQPFIRKYDAWGNRIDELVTSQAWKTQKTIAAKEGIVATAYDDKYGEFDRLYQIIKLYLYCSVSGLYSCPLAMTDGAAKTAMVTKSPILEKAFRHLTSRDPDLFWTSGQWMTEKRGGSDVSGSTETLAVEQDDGAHQLFGYKWFSSATDSDMALTLANIISEDQPVPKPRGLTMFYLETKNTDGKLNGIEIINLKNKLGTRQLPTAELLLDGTRAYQVSDEGRGIACISEMLTITRIHNSISATANMRRIVQLARDYSRRRTAFGNVVSLHPLHQLTSARQEVTTRGCEALTLHVARLLGRQESGTTTEIESLILRVMTPIMKMFTAKCSMAVVSEGLECFGGQGYIEDTGLPALLRDSQVLPIWEGTSNIMSLDFLRAVFKSEGKALTALYEDVKSRLQFVESINDEKIIQNSQKVMKALNQLSVFIKENPELLDRAARDLSMSIAHVYIGSLLLESAAYDKTRVSIDVSTHWCTMPLYQVTPELYSINNSDITMDGYNPENVYGPMF